MRISVALCTYNGDKFIEQQLNSIINQVYDIYEIQIGDDGSTDNTINVINDFKKKFDRIQLTVNSKTLGVVKNFESTIKRCKGEYICLSDQDDIWHPEKLKTIIPVLENNAKIQACFTNASLIDDQGGKIYGSLWESRGLNNKEECVLHSNNILEIILKFGNIATGATMVLKSSCLDKVIPFIPQYDNQYHDEIIARQLAINNEIIYIDKELIDYRIHDDQLSGIPQQDEWSLWFSTKKNILSKKYERVAYKAILTCAWRYYINTSYEIMHNGNASSYLLKKCYINAKNEWENIKKREWLQYSNASTKFIKVDKKKLSLCYFVNYTERGGINIDDFRYINELKRHFDKIVIICNHEVQEKIPDYEYMLVENKGYDFGFLYQAIIKTNLSDYHTIGFVNNSNVLIRGRHLDDFFNWCRSKHALFCGMTDSHQSPPGLDGKHCYHLQSHFLIFKRKAIVYLYEFFIEIHFERFFEITDKKILRQRIINDCEVGLTQYMIKNKINSASWFDSHSYCLKYDINLYRMNLHALCWEKIIEDGYPLIKKKILLGEWDTIIPHVENRLKYI